VRPGGLGGHGLYDVVAVPQRPNPHGVVDVQGALHPMWTPFSVFASVTLKRARGRSTCQTSRSHSSLMRKPPSLGAAMPTAVWDRLGARYVVTDGRHAVLEPLGNLGDRQAAGLELANLDSDVPGSRQLRDAGVLLHEQDSHVVPAERVGQSQAGRPAPDD
jgi:hypothetical protein